MEKDDWIWLGNMIYTANTMWRVDVVQNILNSIKVESEDEYWFINCFQKDIDLKRRNVRKWNGDE